MGYNEYLLEGAAVAHAIQVQLLIAVVFAARDPDRFLDHVRELSALTRRMVALVQGRAAAAYRGRRTERSRL